MIRAEFTLGETVGEIRPGVARAIGVAETIKAHIERATGEVLVAVKCHDELRAREDAERDADETREGWRNEHDAHYVVKRVPAHLMLEIERDGSTTELAAAAVRS